MSEELIKRLRLKAEVLAGLRDATASLLTQAADALSRAPAVQVPEGYRLQPHSEFDAMNAFIRGETKVPPGYALVPVEATEYMQIHAAMVNHSCSFSEVTEEAFGIEACKNAAEMYRAMLAAAPASPAAVAVPDVECAVVVGGDALWREGVEPPDGTLLYLAPPTASPAATGWVPEQEPKYTTDGAAIINRATSEAIPVDEPVFIFRARDIHAREALEAYACVLVPGQHRDKVCERIADFARFAYAQPQRMKEPDTAQPLPPAPSVDGEGCGQVGCVGKCVSGGPSAPVDGEG